MSLLQVNMNKRKTRKCVICGVRESNRLGFFASFPINEERCRDWVCIVGNEDLIHIPIEILHQRYNVCADHFEKHAFNKKRTRLKKNAKPTLKLTALPLRHEQLADFPLHTFKSGVGKIEGVTRAQLEHDYCDTHYDDMEIDVNDDDEELQVLQTTNKTPEGFLRESEVTVASKEHNFHNKASTIGDVQNAMTVLYEAIRLHQSETENGQGVVKTSKHERKIDSSVRTSSIENDQKSLKTSQTGLLVNTESEGKRNDFKEIAAEKVEMNNFNSLCAELSRVKEELRLARRKICTMEKKYKVLNERTKKSAANFKALEKLKLPARIFVEMQLDHVRKSPKGRRFSLDEKILALSFYRASPKCYKLLEKNFIMPSIKTMQLAQGASSDTAVELNQQIKKVELQNIEDRLHSDQIESQLYSYDKDLYKEEFRLIETFMRNKITPPTSSNRNSDQRMLEATVEEFPTTLNVNRSETQLHYLDLRHYNEECIVNSSENVMLE